MASELITIARAELTAEVSRGLIAELNAELSELYPGPGANHFHWIQASGSDFRVFVLSRFRDFQTTAMIGQS